MASPKSTPRPRRTPLKPMRPLGQDDPEDTPSKIRLRSAVESASLRRRQEEDLVKADLQNGLELHEQMMEDRARKSTQAKADAELRRQLFTVQKVHKEAARLEEAEKLQEARALQADEFRARQEWMESLRKAREEEKNEERKMRAETVSHGKEIKATEKAREHEILTRDYQATLVERARREEEKKAVKKEEMAEKKAAIIEAREKRVKDRALAAAALRADVERQREEAKATEEEKRKAAEERRQLLRDRASQYREDKQLLKTSAYTR